MNTKKRIIIIVSIVLVLITGGVGTWIILASRRDQSQESEINQESITLEDLNESTSDTAEEETGSEGEAAMPTDATNRIMTLSTGTFNRIDAIHFGSGDVSLIQQSERYFIKFEPTFSVANGPDLYVYLAEPQEFSDTVNGVDTARTLNVGRLKSESGEQLYEITREQYNRYNGAVVIWCRAFGIQFSRADLM